MTVADLERWRLFGAGCRIAERRGDRAVVELCTCTGEVVERHESGDRRVIDYVLAAQDPPSAEADLQL
ncbi:MAG TPA: hypothetical protein VIK04_03030 [Solirubrobacteraceae bacterium]